MGHLLLRGGRVLDPASGFDAVADVIVGAEGASFGADAAPIAGDHEVRDVTGCWVVPGLIDLRTHLREPGEEHKEDLESGLRAAAAGGYTTVCAMPGTLPPNDTRAVTDMLVARARALGGTRLLPFGCITLGMKGVALTEMAELQAAGVVGVTDDRWPIRDAGLLRRALEYASTFGLVVMQHCEEPDLVRGAFVHEGVRSIRMGLRGWPREAEDAAVARDVRVAEMSGAHLHVAHLSSGGAVEVVREAKARGVRVTADVTPHHLSFTDALLEGFNTLAKVVPPLREESDRQALLAGVRDGTIDAIATDHAPHHALAKECELEVALPGIAGIETAVSLLCALVASGDLPLGTTIAALTTGPANILGRSAALTGARDLTVIDPGAEWTVRADALRSKAANTPLLGARVRGRATLTLVDGRIVHELPEETT